MSTPRTETPYLERIIDLLPARAAQVFNRKIFTSDSTEWNLQTQLTFLRTAELRAYWNRLRTSGVPAWSMNRPARLVPLPPAAKNFRGIDFGLMSFPGSTWTHFQLLDAKFTGANLRGANFRGAELFKTDFRFSNLATAKLPPFKSGQLEPSHIQYARTHARGLKKGGRAANIRGVPTHPLDPHPTHLRPPLHHPSKTHAALWDPYMDTALPNTESVLVLCCPPSLDSFYGHHYLRMWRSVYGHTRVVKQPAYFPLSTEDLRQKIARAGHHPHLVILTPQAAHLTHDVVPIFGYGADPWRSVRAVQRSPRSPRAPDAPPPSTKPTNITDPDNVPFTQY